MSERASSENELYRFVRDHPMIVGGVFGSLTVLTYFAVVGIPW